MRRMLGRIFLAITVVSLLELFLLVKLAQITSFGVTLLLVLATAAVGAWLLRREGARTLVRVRTELGAGQLPGDALVDGLAIGIAGAFLLTPGVLSDIAGILLLIPSVRVLLKALLLIRFQRWIESGNMRVVTVGSGSGFAGGFGGVPPGFGGMPPGFGGMPPGFGEGLGSRGVRPGPASARGSGVVLDGIIDGDALADEAAGPGRPRD